MPESVVAIVRRRVRTGGPQDLQEMTKEAVEDWIDDRVNEMSNVDLLEAISDAVEERFHGK